jgi:ABC-2 type transport system permease protein
MRTLIFSKRCAKEILRDPLTLLFALGFPVVLLLLLSLIQANIPVALFEIQHLTPGITVFGLSFMTLFTATLIAKDRESALLQRLYTTPLRTVDYVFGYTLPMIPISLGQSIITYLLAFALGLTPRIEILYALLGILPVSLLFISLGLLFGSVLSVKQVGGICGALLTNLSAWLSGIWFDLSLVGGVFAAVAKAFPFFHAVELERALLRGDIGEAFTHLPLLSLYIVGICAASILAFTAQMKRH